jgi:hypothetical protein
MNINQNDGLLQLANPLLRGSILSNLNRALNDLLETMEQAQEDAEALEQAIDQVLYGKYSVDH